MKEVEEIQLPEGWRVISIGETCSTGSGGTPSRKNKSFYQGNIPWVKSGELNYQTIIDTEEKITQEAIEKSSAKLVEKGTLLIALYGATVGKLAFLGVDAATNQAVCFVKVPEYLDNKFLYYFLFSKRNDLLQKRIGGAQPNISQGIINETEIPLPPLSEQHRIVAKIEELFSELDNGVAQLRQVQAQLKSYRQSVLKHAFEGKLTEAWRQQHDQLPNAQKLLTTIQQERHTRHQQALKGWQQSVIRWAEAGKPGGTPLGKKPTKPKAPKELPHLSEEEIAKLPALPEGWEWVNLAQIGRVSGDLTKNSKRDQLPDKIPYLRVANVYANRLDLEDITEIGIKEAEVHRVLLKKGDLLIVEGNGSIDQIGRVAVWNNAIQPCAHQNHLIKARFTDCVDEKYILYFLLSGEGRENIKRVASSTSGLHTLSLSKVANLPLPFCSTEEQHQIVQEIESRLSAADYLEKTVEESLRQAEVLRQSILQRAFTGQLVPQDPNDEPATELLKGIQAGKADGEAKSAKAKAASSADEQLSIIF